MDSSNKNQSISDVNYNLPYERFEKFGVESLSNEELFAMILRTGSRDSNVFNTAKALLNHDKLRQFGLPGLHHLTRDDLLKIPGIGYIKSSQLICIFEISKRIRRESASVKFKFDSPKVIADYYMEELRNLEKEHVLALFLDCKHRLISEEIISIGTINASLLDVREVFSKALYVNAFRIILIHNHPSGDPTPSNEDKRITIRLKNAGDLLNLQVYDHIIIGDNCYYSMKEGGYL